MPIHPRVAQFLQTATDAVLRQLDEATPFLEGSTNKVPRNITLEDFAFEPHIENLLREVHQWAKQFKSVQVFSKVDKHLMEHMYFVNEEKAIFRHINLDGSNGCFSFQSMSVGDWERVQPTCSTERKSGLQCALCSRPIFQQ
jgi:hypothetical protein